MTQLTLPAGVHSTAVFDPTGAYRYVLRRTWASGPPVVWVMLNPSVADEQQDDRTVAKCRKYARRWGHGGIVVVNLFALRSTSPAALAKAPDPVGPDNDQHILEQVREGSAEGGLVVAAWGEHNLIHRLVRPRAAAVAGMLAGHDLLCLGQAKAGAPRHPLYMRDDTLPVPWRP